MSDDFMAPLEPIEVVQPSRTPPCPRCNYESDEVPSQYGQPNPRNDHGYPSGKSIVLMCGRCYYRFRVDHGLYLKYRENVAYRDTPSVRSPYYTTVPEPNFDLVTGKPAAGYRLVRKFFK